MGAQHALGRGRRSARELDTTVVALVDRVTRRLRAARRVCRTVVLRLRFDDYSRATRSRTLLEATAETGMILATARELLVAAMPTIEAQGITLIGVALANLEDGSAIQLALPLDSRPTGALDSVLDDVRNRYGSAAITRAVLLGRDERPSVPLLPD
jgi:DNA polymerase-4